LHPYYLALEFAENRSLLSYLNRKSTGEILEEKWVRLYFRQILNGMITIRSKGLCHLDIKVENILIDGNLNAKIGDFGFA
jgi:serine/threonine protein kinase